MKKLFTLVIVSFVSALAIQAQTVKITKTDNSIVTLNANEVSKIEFLPATPAPKPMPPHAFTGYLTVTAPGIFTNKLFGEAATMDVDMKNYVVTFSDSQWGTGTFKVEVKGRELNGTGKITVPNPHSGGSQEYEATMAGTMTNVNITVPNLMNGLVINWRLGKAPAAIKVAGKYTGKYTGTTSLKVGDFGPFESTTVAYTVTANNDGTINVVVPEEVYENVPMMGTVTLGTYTINNLAYDENSNSYSRDYSNDGVKVLFKGKEKSFGATSKMVATVSEAGTLTISNNYVIGRSPMGHSAVYTGKKTK